MIHQIDMTSMFLRTTRQHSKIFTLLLMLVVFGISPISSQTFHHPIQTLHEKPELAFGLDNRYTFIGKQFVIINGAYTDVCFGEKMKFKLGLSGTPFGFETPTNDTLSSSNHLAFITVGHEFDFVRVQKFSLSTYIQTGFGYHYYKIRNDRFSILESGRRGIVPLEVGMNLNYDFNPWLRAKIGYGYRFAFFDDFFPLSGEYAKATFTINIKYLFIALKSNHLF